MQCFIRAVRLVLNYRATLVGVLISSVMVGVLWGGNIAVVYPFVEVILNDGQSLREWIDGEIKESEKIRDDLRAEIQQLQQGLPTLHGEARAGSEIRIGFKQARLEAEDDRLAWSQWIRPFMEYTPISPFQTLVLIVLCLVMGTVLKVSFLVANMVLVERIIQLAVFDLRKQFFRQTLRLDLRAFANDNTNDLLSRFTFDVSCLSVGLNNLFGRAITEPLKMVACLVGACFISWQLLLFSLIVSPGAVFLIRRLAQSIKRANRRAMEEMASLYNNLTETFTGIQTVKAFTMESFERNRLHQWAKEFFRKTMRIAFYNSLSKPITELLGIGVISLALVGGAYLVLNQETHLLGIRMSDRPFSIAEMMLFYAFLAGVSDPARKLSDILARIQGGVAAAERIYAMMDREPTIVDPATPRAVCRPHRELTLEQVAFQYQANQPVLNNIDLSIQFGETIAIVGPNGCGKSTLINLIPRFYDPVEGTLRLDGIDLREMQIRDIRTRIGLVTQQTHLFDDSVLNNIRYGTPRASDDEVIEAAKKAHADRFIVEKLTDGYATLVGQNGGRLSGGQRQRIALARAILRNPEILILDEATSQIDLESEQLIHRVLKEFVRGRTTILITHRLSTLTLADRIVVMDAGTIVDCATHEKLLQRCPLYQRLHEIQFKRTA